ncbi:MAG: FAD-dependent oxidoreductase [Erythrobacter sp.]|uniref:NAD(P)/FAD-dependent oxidoreductase n=1 Tax=Erythrobacter sp. TaxID=1042 RepID=UPI0026172B86|nr:FAD-dependent oxidoreductase [Erythrobacter sp.]MDJ0978862.1 FAD-dependent oxidoreductase [Erythrobacter sp.]
MSASHSDIAIIGAGMAGLACATRLKAAGRLVRVFDKGRGPGGRMAARRVELNGETVRFDHGAQYFTARDPAFRDAVAGWEAQGVVARWHAASRAAEDPAFVGAPGMNGPIKAMANAVGGVHWSTRIKDLTRDGDMWRMTTTDSADYTASTVLIAIPAEQASDLLQTVAPEFADIAASVTSEPCWAVMAAFARPLAIEPDTLRDAEAKISWAARNSAKPGRGGPEGWVLHASPRRSRQIIDRAKQDAAEILLADFFDQTGTDRVDPIHLVAHRWLYAQPTSLKGEPARYEPKARIGIAGDYLHSPRVEGAWVSGTALADLVLGGG